MVIRGGTHLASPLKGSGCIVSHDDGIGEVRGVKDAWGTEVGPEVLHVTIGEAHNDHIGARLADRLHVALLPRGSGLGLDVPVETGPEWCRKKPFGTHL